MVVKKGITYQRVDPLSRLITGEAPIGVNDDLQDTYLFNVEMIPDEWSRNLVPLLTIGKLRLDDSMDMNLSLVEQSKEYSMIAGKLYKLGKDGILRLYVETQEIGMYLERAYIALGNIHMSPRQTMKRVERMGVYWPTMRKDIHSYVQNCSCEMGLQVELYSFTTLYLVSSITPKWAEPIVKFLMTHIFPENMSKTRQRYL